MAAAVLQHEHNLSQIMFRLATFSTFPDTDIFVSKLTSAGLYSTNSGKEVKCFECSFICSDWYSTQDLFQKHYAFNSNCSFSSQELGVAPVISKPEVSGSDRVRERRSELSIASAASDLQTDEAPNYSQGQGQNVLGETKKENNVSNNHNSEVKDQSNWRPTTDQEKRDTLSGLGIIIAKPKYAKYAILSSRASTFKHWPSHLKQKPQDLAAAGFYYSGTGDHVQCFYCGGGLTDWEEDDDPWAEHARWFPECVHVNNCKGREFIQSVQEPNLNEDGEPHIPTESFVSADSIETDKRYASSCNSDNSNSLNSLDTIAVKSILATGYDLDIVKQAVAVWTTRNTNKSYTATDLIEIVFEIEEGAYSGQSSGNISNATQDNNNTANKQSDESSDCSGNDSEASPQNSKEVEAMMEETREMKDRMLCKICMDKMVSMVFLPCGHLVTCSQCAPAMKRCPICRATVKGKVKAYL